MRSPLLLALGVAGTLGAGAAGLRTAPAGEMHPYSMRVELVAPRKVAVGAPVPLAIRIVNTADRPVELHLLGRITAFDLIVRRGDSTVWRRLEGEAVQAILQLRVLAPGEVLELQDTWSQRDRAGAAVGPGEYSVSGAVPTDGEPIRAGPVTLTIEG